MLYYHPVQSALIDFAGRKRWTDKYYT